jgi:hypothetical protein
LGEDRSIIPLSLLFVPQNTYEHKKGDAEKNLENGIEKLLDEL